MLSNSDTPFTRALYNGYNIEIVIASRSISKKTKATQELIIRNYS